MKLSKTHRNGYTLIEMVASLILVSTLSSMLVVLTRRAVQGYSHTIDRLFAEQTAQRWMEQLRLDIHQAVDASLGPSRDSLTLKWSDRESIEYAQGIDRASRQRTIDGRVLTAEETPWSSVFFERIEMPNGNLIEATINAELKLRARLGCESNTKGFVKQ